MRIKAFLFMFARVWLLVAARNEPNNQIAGQTRLNPVKLFFEILIVVVTFETIR